MKTLKKSSVAMAILIGGATLASAASFTLSNSLGDGSLSVGVDGYGAFGSSIGANAANAQYDPLGPIATAGTSFESAVAIRFDTSGARSFLTSGDIGSSGNLTNPTVTGTTSSGTSSFSFGALDFVLKQTLTSTFSGLVRTGSILTQSYEITAREDNTYFELVRYLDGDLRFDGSLIDGGGRLVGDTDILFETDSATGSATSTTFVGITAQGGTEPVAGRFEIDSYSGLRSRIISGIDLDNVVTGDGPDLDLFVDAGAGYDITLALNNTFLLNSGETSTYTTKTLFGTGAPRDSIPTNPTSSVPDSGSTLVLLALGLFSFIGFRFRKA